MSSNIRVSALSAGAPYAVTLEDAAGHRWLADEPPAAGGGDTGPGPHALLLGSLGACTAISVRMYAAHKGWPLASVKVELTFNPAGPPAEGGSEIRRHLTLHGELSGDQRNKLLEVANKCPIHRVLTGEVRISTALGLP